MGTVSDVSALLEKASSPLLRALPDFERQFLRNLKRCCYFRHLDPVYSMIAGLLVVLELMIMGITVTPLFSLTFIEMTHTCYRIRSYSNYDFCPKHNLFCVRLPSDSQQGRVLLQLVWSNRGCVQAMRQWTSGKSHLLLYLDLLILLTLYYMIIVFWITLRTACVASEIWDTVSSSTRVRSPCTASSL